MTNQIFKKKLFESGLKQPICESCGVGEVWNNKPLVLQIHHIDGDPLNNKIDNIQIVCPNCHSQTSNFRCKKIITDKEWIKYLKQSKTMGEAIRRSGTHPSGGKYKRLERLIINHKLTHIKKYDYISNNKGGRGGSKQQPIPKKICPHCKAKFRKKTQYCSKECRNVAHRKYTDKQCYDIIETVQNGGWLEAARKYHQKSDVVLREAIKRFIRRNKLDIDFYSLSKFSNHSQFK